MLWIVLEKGRIHPKKRTEHFIRTATPCLSMLDLTPQAPVDVWR